MNALTQNYLVSSFRRYYIESSLDTPPGLESREWGFLFFDDSGMRRHKSFFSRGELVDYVRRLANPDLKAAFVVHGEEPAGLALAEGLAELVKGQVVVPRLKDAYTLPS